MSTGLKRGIWAALLLICLAVGAFALRGAFAFGEPPITPATPSPAPAAAGTSVSSPQPATSSANGSSASALSTTKAAPAATSPSATTAATSDAAEPPSAPAPATTAAASSDGAAQDTATAAETAPEESASDPGAAAPAPAEEPTAEDEVAARMTGPAAPWEDVTAAPAHIDVYADGELIIGAPIQLVQMQDGGELNPDPETVGWYGPPQWGTTPGETSGHPGILTGHVRNYGGKDVFWNLQGLAAGALVVVTYDDGTQAAFRTDADAVSMGKDALTHDPAYGWAWELPTEGTKLTLITCDADSGPGAVGTSTNNWAVQATRVA